MSWPLLRRLPRLCTGGGPPGLCHTLSPSPLLAWSSPSAFPYQDRAKPESHIKATWGFQRTLHPVGVPGFLWSVLWGTPFYERELPRMQFWISPGYWELSLAPGNKQLLPNKHCQEWWVHKWILRSTINCPVSDFRQSRSLTSPRW